MRRLGLPGAGALLLGLLATGARPSQGPAGDRILILPIEGEINTAVRAFVNRVVGRALSEKPDLVLFEIDTPGGEVLSMLAITEEILRLKHAGIRTAAYIRRAESGEYVGGSAASAGAFISFACQRIYMARASVIGASQPVIIDPQEGVKPASGKTVSFLKAKLAAIAAENSYPEPIAIAMVDPDHEVFFLHGEGGRPLRFMSAEDKEALPEADQARVRLLTKKGQPLTLTVAEAESFGIASKADTREAVLAAEGLASAAVTTEAFTWSEDMAGFLTQPFVQSLILLLALVAGYLEIKTPGFGFFGVSSIALFGLLIFGHHLAGLAGAIEIVLIGVGIALVAVEIFVFPGTMFGGILGTLFILTGLVMMMVPFSWPSFENPFQTDALVSALAQIVGTFLASIMIFLVAARFVRQIPVLRRLVLQAEIGGGGAAANVRDGVPEAPGPGLEGRTGVALTRLSPGGKAEFDGSIVDVVSQGEYIEAGAAVRVVSVQGRRIVVALVQ